jgi:hypothetical protein
MVVDLRVLFKNPVTHVATGGIDHGIIPGAVLVSMCCGAIKHLGKVIVEPR